MKCILRFAVVGIVGMLVAGSAMAQDGIYGSFIVGQKFLDMKGLNKAVQEAYLNTPFSVEEFPSNFWSLGGEGHVIVAKHFVVGGKGSAIWWEREIKSTIPNDTIRRFAKISGGIGIGSVGYVIGGKTLRLMPQVGVGIAPFLFQTKSTDTIKDFENIVRTSNDNMVVLAKGGLILDACLSLDWYIQMIKMLAIIPGLETGPLIHAELGYSFSPANIYWMRDTDMLDSYHPDMKFDGMYINVGIGIGLSSSKD